MKSIKTKYLQWTMYFIVVCLVASAIGITYCFVYYPDKHINGLNGLGPILLLAMLGIQSIIKKRTAKESKNNQQK